MNSFRLLSVGLWLSSVGCVTWKPVDIPNSDPNLAAQQRAQKKQDEQNIEAFIAQHPELDDQTKTDLRAGTITIHEAMDRLHKQNPPH